ncbi:uncharacterized protein LOC122632376 [Vespula pensylvanica]|uniref:PID domain-containing protein n=1 Tax=Vespula pensylvanica TaxID=30213 RepID=A0A834U4S4_VESPE|nr:uncharacterized protein LOC122632376 [Vespula pensylvanica]XP_043675020.1 uncharacterized protein LOC122632376 [Vespula pensylvanica]KAF7416553.1 hypothetical protein H0235_011084 [Vespula pensylvanica]
MEDEDFGFTKRDNRALVKILTVEKEEGNTQKERGPSSAPTRAAAAGGSGGDGNRSRSKTAPSSVPNNAPNIPNVVEYHLKVKPPSKINKLEEQSRSNHKEEMKKDLLSVTENKKDLITQLSRLSIDNNVFEGSTDLPQVFQVKYLGSHDARGLWGIKHTRQPVDNMVTSAKALPTNTMLPLIKLVVSQEGVALLPLDKRKQEGNIAKMYAIETISYGVQDLVYTRVFSMIVVRETDNFRRVSPFECHGFVCESKHHARQLTYALATAFEIYSRKVKFQDKTNSENVVSSTKKRFAIDLRTPEEIEADLCMDSEA